MRRPIIVALTLIGSFGYGFAHDTWENGVTVPPWVKQHCCGVADIHRYSVGEIRHDHNGWHVPGLKQAIPASLAQGSEDEYVWAFFPNREPDESETIPVWCFFIPQGSV